MQAAQDLAHDVGLVAACKAMLVSRASVYRSINPAAQHIASATHPRALDNIERAEVLSVLTSERFVDRSPAAVRAALLEDDRYLCSVSTMYRVLAGAPAPANGQWCGIFYPGR